MDLHVLQDWIIVVFADSVKIFHFAKGFTRNKIVAQYQIRKLEAGQRQGQVSGHVSSESSKKLTLIF